MCVCIENNIVKNEENEIEGGNNIPVDELLEMRESNSFVKEYVKRKYGIAYDYKPSQIVINMLSNTQSQFVYNSNNDTTTDDASNQSDNDWSFFIYIYKYILLIFSFSSLRLLVKKETFFGRVYKVNFVIKRKLR